MLIVVLRPWQRKSKKVLARLWVVVYSFFLRHAGLAQLVARHLAKVEVAGSNPVARSMNCRRSTFGLAAFLLRMDGACFLPRAGDRREPRFTEAAVFPVLLEPTFPRGIVLGSCPEPTLPRSAVLWNTAERGEMGSAPSMDTAEGWDVGSMSSANTVMRVDIGPKLRFRANRPRPAPRDAWFPKIFSNEFEIWACARLKLPVYYPLRLRA